MIIDSGNNHNGFKNQVISSANSFQNNTFQNNFGKNQAFSQNTISKNVFVKDIKEQKYSNSLDTTGMQDKTLAMLHDRLKNGTITMEEFNRKCMQLGKQRQETTKINNLH